MASLKRGGRSEVSVTSQKKLVLYPQVSEIAGVRAFDAFAGTVLGSPLAAFAASGCNAFYATRALGGSTIAGASAR